MRSSQDEAESVGYEKGAHGLNKIFVVNALLLGSVVLLVVPIRTGNGSA